MKIAIKEDRKRMGPRERLIRAAVKLFYGKGIRNVGIEAIAEEAKTTKMALYRHFDSKDALVCAWLERLNGESDDRWEEIVAVFPNDPLGQLGQWLKLMTARMLMEDERGCPFANANAELAERDHPARRVITAHKERQHARLIGLCRALGVADALKLADLILFTVEGARLCGQYFNNFAIAERLPETIADLLVRFGVVTESDSLQTKIMS